MDYIWRNIKQHAGENSSKLLGTIDKEATDRVYIRYDLDYHSTKKTVLHELQFLCPVEIS